MNNDLLRQRRNLIIISSVLIIFNLANLSISKVVLLGTELSIGKPKVLIVVAWILWSYFFIRYYQYLRDEDDLKISSTYFNYFYELFNKYTRLKTVQESFGDKISNTTNWNLYYVHLFKWECELTKYDTSLGEQKAIDSKPIPFNNIITWFLKSLFHVLINTVVFTDYIVPIIIALIAPIVFFLF